MHHTPRREFTRDMRFGCQNPNLAMSVSAGQNMVMLSNLHASYSHYVRAATGQDKAFCHSLLASAWRNSTCLSRLCKDNARSDNTKATHLLIFVFGQLTGGHDNRELLGGPSGVNFAIVQMLCSTHGAVKLSAALKSHTLGRLHRKMCIEHQTKLLAEQTINHTLERKNTCLPIPLLPCCNHVTLSSTKANHMNVPPNKCSDMFCDGLGSEGHLQDGCAELILGICALEAGAPNPDLSPPLSEHPSLSSCDASQMPLMGAY